MSLTTPSSVQKLQRALHAKAKEAPKFRFYALYDKVYRRDVLAHAYERCEANGGAAGVDDQTFEDIEQYGAERWLDELTQELKSRTYQPKPVRRVYIPKPDGKQRPLGIPTIRDRVVQTAAGLVLEPIFEADLPPEQYDYRADHSALYAVQDVHKLINTGHKQIVDAGLSSYFDSVPHAELMKSVARRVVDGAMLHLIKMWLEAPVEATDEHGNTRRSTRNRDEDVEAKVDGEREQDAGLPSAEGEVRLSGVHVRAMLLDAKGPNLSRYDPFEETSAARLSRHQRRNWARYHRTNSAEHGGKAQSNSDRLGQLLLSGSGQQSLQRGRCPHPPQAASVALRQV